jgi:hypothetical protein
LPKNFNHHNEQQRFCVIVAGEIAFERTMNAAAMNDEAVLSFGFSAAAARSTLF